MRVLRVHHGGRDPANRARERELRELGVELTLVVPETWPVAGSERALSREPFPMVELPVVRPGDVNRHDYADLDALRSLLARLAPDVLDIHEEPFSLAASRWLAAAPPELPVVMYTAQNVDKRYPPPFSLYERRAFEQVSALYACSRQSASRARGRGFEGLIEVLPLGFDPALLHGGAQALPAPELVLALVGRLVPEKGGDQALRVLQALNQRRPTRLMLVGEGPYEDALRERARSLGVLDRVDIRPWLAGAELASVYREAHVTLVLSVPTARWTEQFGRVIVEAQASGSVVAGYASGSIPEVSAGAALLAPPGDSLGLANEIERLAEDPARYTALRARGLAISRSRTWRSVAERKLELYRRVLGGEAVRLELPRSPRRRRVLAQAEFGETAPTVAGKRPFALPVLRNGGEIPRALAAAIDAGAELVAGLRSAVDGRR